MGKAAGRGGRAEEGGLFVQNFPDGGQIAGDHGFAGGHVFKKLQGGGESFADFLAMVGQHADEGFGEGFGQIGARHVTEEFAAAADLPPGGQPLFFGHLARTSSEDPEFLAGQITHGFDHRIDAFPAEEGTGVDDLVRIGLGGVQLPEQVQIHSIRRLDHGAADGEMLVQIVHEIVGDGHQSLDMGINEVFLVEQALEFVRGVHLAEGKNFVRFKYQGNVREFVKAKLGHLQVACVDQFHGLVLAVCGDEIPQGPKEDRLEGNGESFGEPDVTGKEDKLQIGQRRQVEVIENPLAGHIGVVSHAQNHFVSALGQGMAGVDRLDLTRFLEGYFFGIGIKDSHGNGQVEVYPGFDLGLRMP